MSNHIIPEFSPFDLAIKPKRSRWHWSLRDHAGRLMMEGREKSRAAARYQSERALFLMLLASGLSAACAAASPPQRQDAASPTRRPV